MMSYRRDVRCRTKTSLTALGGHPAQHSAAACEAVAAYALAAYEVADAACGVVAAAREAVDTAAGHEVAAAWAQTDTAALAEALAEAQADVGASGTAALGSSTAAEALEGSLEAGRQKVAGWAHAAAPGLWPVSALHLVEHWQEKGSPHLLGRQSFPGLGWWTPDPGHRAAEPCGSSGLQSSTWSP